MSGKSSYIIKFTRQIFLTLLSIIFCLGITACSNDDVSVKQNEDMGDSTLIPENMQLPTQEKMSEIDKFASKYEDVIEVKENPIDGSISILPKEYILTITFNINPYIYITGEGDIYYDLFVSFAAEEFGHIDKIELQGESSSLTMETKLAKSQDIPIDGITYNILNFTLSGSGLENLRNIVSTDVVECTIFTENVEVNETLSQEEINLLRDFFEYYDLLIAAQPISSGEEVPAGSVVFSDPEGYEKLDGETQMYTTGSDETGDLIMIMSGDFITSDSEEIRDFIKSTKDFENNENINFTWVHPSGVPIQNAVIESIPVAGIQSARISGEFTNTVGITLKTEVYYIPESQTIQQVIMLSNIDVAEKAMADMKIFIDSAQITE